MAMPVRQPRHHLEREQPKEHQPADKRQKDEQHRKQYFH